jgi:glycosyltransferase involved in cell wall biosynthesis
VHVAQISFFTDPQARPPEKLLTEWPSLPDVAECAYKAGARVSVVQACTRSQRMTRNGVDYHFMPFGRGRKGHDGSAGCDDVAGPASSARLSDLLRRLAPDVLHVHGLDFPLDVESLAAIAPGIPILLQDHASRPPRRWRRNLWRRGFSAASGIAFCCREQASPFAAAGLIAPQTVLFEIPESSSRFLPGEQAEARRSSGVSGDPVALWVGHLDANKDPLAVLDGISRAVSALPALQLYCCYGNAPLLRAVKRRITDDPLLSGRVHLLGRVPHPQIERLMRAADFFVSGSHREGSGYALIEAAACGLPTVVTDIPSFHALTGSGSTGALWARGDAAALCEKLIALAAHPRAPMRAATRDYFERELSFDAVGRRLAAAYQDLVERGRHRQSRAQSTRLAGSPAVSIIIPVFNRLRYLRAALESVLAQSFQDWELLIADDGSDDHTRDYLRTLPDGNRIKVLWLAHTGNPSAVRNAALREATGEYVAFLDSDDVWTQGKLQAQIARLHPLGAFEWSYTAFALIDGSGSAIPRPSIQRSASIAGRTLERLVRGDTLIVTPSVVVRRELIELVGGYNEELMACEDYELWMRLAARAEADFIDEPLVLVRRHADHSFDDITCLENQRRAIEITQRSGVAGHLNNLLTGRRAMVSANLAKAHALDKRRWRVLAALFESAPYSWRHAAWWTGALEAMVRAFAPQRALLALRRYRHGRRAGLGPPP